jgi:hypothetical protein
MATFQQPTTGLGSVEETNRLLQEASKQTGLAAPTFSPTGAITSETLSGNVPSYKLPTPDVLTGADGLVGAVEAGSTAFATTQAETQAKRDEAAKVSQAQSAKDTSKQSLLEIMGITKGEATLTNEAYSETVDPVETELKAINQEILEEQNALRKRKEALQGSGLTDVQRGAQEREMVRQSASLQADLYIKQLGIQGRYDSAKAIADRKVAMLLEKDAQDIAMLTFAYNENKADFTLAEQRQFDGMIKEKENALKTKEALETYKSNITIEAMKNGVKIPYSVQQEINRASNQAEVNAILARNGISLADPLDRQIKQAQLAKLNLDLSQSQLAGIEAQAGQISPYQQERQTRVLDSVAELRKRVGIATVGIVSLGKFLPGSNPRNFKTDLDTLKASIAFGELTAMREASKTGGALGQVSDNELRLLESALGGLDQGQSPANFRKNLDKVEASIKRWQSAVNKSGVSEADIQEVNGVRYKKAEDGLYYPI